jgi:superfamily II DNA/RNA helicase
VFSNRRDQVRKLADDIYRNGINCGMLSGEVAQNKRISTLESFKTGKFKVLVATDVAGRGLHIEDVTHVVNYSRQVRENAERAAERCKHARDATLREARGNGEHDTGSRNENHDERGDEELY